MFFVKLLFITSGVFYVENLYRKHEIESESRIWNVSIFCSILLFVVCNERWARGRPITKKRKYFDKSQQMFILLFILTIITRTIMSRNVP